MHQRLHNSTCKTWSQVYYNPVDSGLRGTLSPVYREQITVVRYHPAYWAQRDPFALPCGLGTRHHCIQRYAQPSRILGTIMHHHPATRARSIHIISISLRPEHRATLCHSRVACNIINSTSPGSQVIKMRPSKILSFGSQPWSLFQKTFGLPNMICSFTISCYQYKAMP